MWTLTLCTLCVDDHVLLVADSRTSFRSRPRIMYSQWRTHTLISDHLLTVHYCLMSTLSRLPSDLVHTQKFWAFARKLSSQLLFVGSTLISPALMPLSEVPRSVVDQTLFISSSFSWSPLRLCYLMQRPLPFPGRWRWPWCSSALCLVLKGQEFWCWSPTVSRSAWQPSACPPMIVVALEEAAVQLCWGSREQRRCVLVQLRHILVPGGRGARDHLVLAGLPRNNHRIVLRMSLQWSCGQSQ